MHALDLPGRKVVMQARVAYAVFRRAIDTTLAEVSEVIDLAPLGACFGIPLAQLDAVTAQLAALQQGDPDRALANATLYLDAVGRIVATWIWLKQALAAQRGAASADFYRGTLQAARYYIRWELPATAPQFELPATLADAPLAMRDAWF